MKESGQTWNIFAWVMLILYKTTTVLGTKDAQSFQKQYCHYYNNWTYVHCYLWRRQSNLRWRLPLFDEISMEATEYTLLNWKVWTKESNYLSWSNSPWESVLASVVRNTFTDVIFFKRLIEMEEKNIFLEDPSFPSANGVWIQWEKMAMICLY